MPRKLKYPVRYITTTIVVRDEDYADAMLSLSDWFGSNDISMCHPEKGTAVGPAKPCPKWMKECLYGDE